VQAFSLHPGKILTPLQRHITRQEMIDIGWVDEDGNGIDPASAAVLWALSEELTK